MSAPQDIAVDAAVVAQSTAQKAGLRRPVTFLTLSPVHSESFPKAPQSPELAPVAVPAASVAQVVSAPGSPTELKIHRNSSSASVSEKKRFLKLGPVFWGGNVGEDDYALEV